MCFIIKTKKAKAKNDIKTYKILKECVIPLEGHRHTFYSIYHDLEYILGKCQEKIKMHPILRRVFYQAHRFPYMIKFGYHSYDSIIKAYEMLDDMSTKHKIVECIIPKGTHYYTNTDKGERVSEVIKPIKEIK